MNQVSQEQAHQVRANPDHHVDLRRGATDEPGESTTPPTRTLRRDEPAGPAKKRGWVWLVVIVGLAIGGYFIYRHFKTKQGQTTQAADKGGGRGGPRITPVIAVATERGSMPLYLNGLGTVTPLNTVTVRSRVDGQIETVAFTEGQFINAGDLLAQIDPRPFQVQLEQARGQLARDQAILQNAKSELNRNEEAREAIAAQVLETARAAVRQNEGLVRSDEAQVHNAQLQLEYARVTAPISGRVGLRMIDTGNIIRSNDTALAVITQLQPITVVFTLPQDDIQRVLKAMNTASDVTGSTSRPATVGLAVEAWDRDIKNKLATGTLLATDNQVDPTTGTLKLKASFPNQDGSLFPNQFVNARLLVETRRQVVIAPSAAIQHGPDSTYAYVVTGHTVDLRTIKVGPTEADRVIVESGLEPGELVVTDGVDRLQKGSRVEVRAGATTRPATGRSDNAAQPARRRGRSE